MNQKEIEFRNSEGLRQSLHQVLQNDTLKRALETIMSHPDEFPSPIPGVHYDLILAREHSKTVGVNSAIKRLHELTKPIRDDKKEADVIERPQWGDYFTDKDQPE